MKNETTKQTECAPASSQRMVRHRSVIAKTMSEEMDRMTLAHLESRIAPDRPYISAPIRQETSLLAFLFCRAFRGYRRASSATTRISSWLYLREDKLNVVTRLLRTLLGWDRPYVCVMPNDPSSATPDRKPNELP